MTLLKNNSTVKKSIQGVGAFAPYETREVSHEIAQEFGAALPQLCALPAMALLLAGQGDCERAVELYALALRYPLVAKSHWLADVVGKQITAAANTLPAERVGLLQERGRARDLEATVAELMAELCE